jgi:signal transduction histidine kinase
MNPALAPHLARHLGVADPASLEATLAACEAAATREAGPLAAVRRGLRGLLAELLDAIAVAIYDKDANGRFLGINRALERLFDLSKVEAGRLELESIDFEPRALLEHLCRPIALSAQRKPLDARLELGAEVPAFARGDPGRLRQVLVNLWATQ